MRKSPAAGARDVAARGRTGELATVGVLFLAAMVVRVFFHRPDALWLDEANTVLIAGRSPSEILAALRDDGNPPLYYCLLHAWMRLVGEGEGAVRAFSLLCGALLPPLLYLAGKSLFGRSAGWTSALLGLAWPLHVYYSQQVRMYALVPVVALGFMVALFRALRAASGTAELAASRTARCVRGAFLHWSAVTVTALALVWLHHYGMFFVAAAPLAWLAAGPRTSIALKCLAGALAAAFVINLPWLLVVFRQAESAVGAWIAASFRPEAAVHSLLLFGAGWRVPASVQGLSGPGVAPALSVAWFLIAGIGGTALALRARGGSVPGESARRHAAALLPFLLVPIAVPWLVSLLGRPIYYVGRYEIVAYPAFALLVGAGVASIERRIYARRGLRAAARSAVAVVLGLYIAMALLALDRYGNAPPDRTTEMIAERLALWASSGDLIVTTGLGRAPIEYYLGRLDDDRVRIESYPRAAALHMGWFDIDAATKDRAALDAEARALADRLRAFSGTVFLVDNAHFPEFRALNEPLRRHLAGAATRHQVLLRAGPDPEAVPLFEVSGYQFAE